ncbi:serine/threonine protein phosphatase 1 [Virgibacillus halotolerans]|uniref:metallophosphoesterase n=1 Tax=Virgibacillus halotolerans TaxID=1071053 RepID=UPI001961D0AF|nr:metallophosphoesterase [Virgibacillus halotolerans]MBM7599757.1 serine/threonine protein phosphatase 1 [Virgibacillus halotolerans]
MRTFFISDIHGNFCVFKNLLDHVEFDPLNDQLIIGGDMINRGPRSAIVLQWVKEHTEQYPDNVHVIAGNHEEMMIWFMKELSPIWMEFGGDETIKNFKKVYGDENGWSVAERYASWLETLPLIYEDENGIYTHAGIDVKADKMNQPRDIVWLNKRDLHQFDEQEIEAWSNGKVIYRGHNPSSAVYLEKQFVHCDLGCGMFEDTQAALALVEVNRNRYFRCDMDGEISVHNIQGMDLDS